MSFVEHLRTINRRGIRCRPCGPRVLEAELLTERDRAFVEVDDTELHRDAVANLSTEALAKLDEARAPKAAQRVGANRPNPADGRRSPPSAAGCPAGSSAGWRSGGHGSRFRPPSGSPVPPEGRPPARSAARFHRPRPWPAARSSRGTRCRRGSSSSPQPAGAGTWPPDCRWPR